MGCSGDREKGTVTEEQKWDYITLADFKSTSCLAPLSYGWLWILVVIGIAVYAADTFTAVNLLAFNRWSSQVQPAIPFQVSKWIFAICIILSWVICGFEWIRAIRVIRRGGVAESYLDPLAVILQSIRMGGEGRGWRRFLVFAELTKSRKGTDYVALFVYFQFKGALRIILAEGPRQVVNALTLWSVMQADLVPTGTHKASDGHSSFVQFFVNIGILAEANKEQAVILFSMLFTLVIWVLSALSLIIAVILYLLFLWHYIPSTDGRLSNYCRRKVDSRLERIVSVKVKKALEKQEAKRKKEERKAMKNGRKPGQPTRQPTLPMLGDSPDLKSSSQFSFARTDTSSTLPQYSSQPPTRAGSPTLGYASRGPTPPDLGQDGRRPQMPSRSGTQSSAFSNGSYSSDAPLLGQASNMGYGEPGRSESPVPPLPTFNSEDNFRRPPVNRSATGSSMSFQRPFSPMSRPPTAQGRDTPISSAGSTQPRNAFRPPIRTNTGFSTQSRNSPLSGATTPLSRQDTTLSDNSGYGPYHHPTRPPPRQTTSTPSSTARRTPGPSPLTPISPFDRRAPTLAHGPSYEMSPVDRAPAQEPGYDIEDYFAHEPSDGHGALTPAPTAAAGEAARGYVAYNPSMHAQSGSASSIGGGDGVGVVDAPRRDVSSPLPRAQTAGGVRQPVRSVTAPMLPR